MLVGRIVLIGRISVILWNHEGVSGILIMFFFTWMAVYIDMFPLGKRFLKCVLTVYTLYFL